MKGEIITTLAIVSLFFVTGLASATSVSDQSIQTNATDIIYVDDDYNDATPGWQIDHFNCIQDAINASENSDTISVNNGVYPERIKVNKTLTLIGESNENTIIDSEQQGSPVTINADNSYISDFKIINTSNYTRGHDYKMTGIVVNSDGNTIYHNTLSNHMQALELFSTSDNIIQNNIIKDNLMDFPDSPSIYGKGIALSESTNNKIIGNIFEFNYKGIVLNSESTNNNISHNVLTDNYYGIICNSDENDIIENIIVTCNITGMLISNSNENTIYNNSIYDSLNGLMIEKSTLNEVSNNKFSHNQNTIVLKESNDNKIFKNGIENSTKIGVYLEDSKSNQIYHNNFINCEKQATFLRSFFTKWTGNYWEKPHILPKMILGRMGKLFSLIPWVNFDWHPAKEPIDI